jgi:exonuclease III
MKEPLKLAQCILQCKFLKNDITFLQETHIIGHQTTTFEETELEGWTYINSGMKMKASAGVGMALSPNVKIVDIDNSIFEGRILLVRLILHGIKLSAFCVYAPTEEYAESSKLSFYNTLQKSILNTKKKYPGFKVIIGGDMNATIGCDSNGSWSYLGTNNDDLPTNDNGTRLLSLSQECNLFIMNSLFDGPPKHRHTWYSPTGFTKRIDYILAEWHIKKLSSSCRVYRRASIQFESDHRFLALYCSLPSKRERKSCFRKPGIPNKSYTNISSLKDNPQVLDSFSTKLDELLADEPSVNDINTFEQSFTESIRQASEEMIPKSTASSAPPCPWTNAEFLNLLDQRRQCRDPANLRVLNNSIKSMRTKLKNDYFSNLAKNINLANESRKVEEEFRLCKNYTMIKHSDKQLISNDTLSDFFENHFCAKNIDLQPEVTNPEDHPHILPPDDMEVNSDPPEIEEVQEILKGFKNGKCLGTDLLHPEHLKYNKSNRFLVCLMLLMTTIWTTCVIPSSWLVSSITCLFKNKGSRSDAANYRGLSIMSTCSKLLASLIISRIRKAYEAIISNCQFGFRSNRSTTDAIFILQNAINLSDKPLFLCFIDLKAAYDWIDRDMLYKILEIRLKSPVLVNILKAFYTGTSAAIKGSKVFFKTFSGCRQGGVESPVIFNIYLDFVLRCVEHEVLQKFPNTGLKYSFVIPGHCSTRQQRSIHRLSGTERLRMILYADDIVLLCNDINELSEIVNIYDKTFARFGLKISTDKTETMAFNVDEEIKTKPSLISVGDVALKNVRSFKYLGHMIKNTDEDPSHFLNFRISSAFQKWNELKHILTDRKILMSTRAKILEACVRSRLLYSVQAWKLTAQELKKIESIWFSFLRKMVVNGFKRKNVPPEYLKALKQSKKGSKEDPQPHVPKPDDLDWSYVFSNQQLKEITKTKNIAKFCKTQHMRFIAHVTRLGNTSLQKQLLFSTDHKKYARDRWLQFEKDLNISKIQIQALMQNKKQFASLLKNIFH